MPKLDGYQATQEIRKFINEKGCEQPFIVGLSGHSEAKYIKRALDSGMDKFITKPSQLEDVRAAIAHINL